MGERTNGVDTNDQFVSRRELALLRIHMQCGAPLMEHREAQQYTRNHSGPAILSIPNNRHVATL